MVYNFFNTVPPLTPLRLLVEGKRTKEEALREKMKGYRLVAIAEAKGKSGGVELWARHSIQGTRVVASRVETFNNRAIKADIKIEPKSQRIIGVYGYSNNARGNRHLENMLRSWWKPGAAIMGDWNDLESEGLGLDGWVLAGQPHPRTTWEGREGQKPARLDKAIGPNNMRVIHLAFPLRRNQTRISDHRPLLVNYPSKRSTKEGYRRIFAPDWVAQTKFGQKELQDEYKRVSNLRWSSRMRKIWMKTFEIRNELLSRDDLQEQVKKAKKNRWTQNLDPNPIITSRLQRSLKSPNGGSLSLKEATEHFRKRWEDEIPQWKLGGGRVSKYPLFKVSPEMVQRNIQHLKAGKSPGPDGITPIILKALGVDLAKDLSKLFNYWLCGHKIAGWWKRGLVTLIYKNKGCVSDVANWRPIALLNHMWKVFSSIVNDKLVKKRVLLRREPNWMGLAQVDA